MTLITVPCAVCGGTDFTLVYPATVADPEADPARYYSSSRTLAGYLDVVRCRQCGLLMVNPCDADATPAGVYTALQDATYDEEEDNRRRTACRKAEYVCRLIVRFVDGIVSPVEGCAMQCWVSLS